MKEISPVSLTQCISCIAFFGQQMLCIDAWFSVSAGFLALKIQIPYYFVRIETYRMICFPPFLQGINGILADEMGLGKTVQSIALLAHLAEVRGSHRPRGRFYRIPPKGFVEYSIVSAL